MEFIRWENHSADLCVSLSKLYRNVELFDCILKTDGGFVKCHKAILAACSPYFKKMFVGHQGTNTVTFKEIKYHDMKHILDFIYYGEVDVQVTDVDSFLKTAEVLQITSLNRFASQSFSEKCSLNYAREKSDHERVDFDDGNEGTDLPVERVLGTSEKDDQSSSPSHSGLTPGTEAVDVTRQVVNDVESDNVIEDVRVEEVQVNVKEEMKSFTFVSIPPAADKTEGDVHCVEVKNPLEVCPQDSYQGVKTESEIKVEFKTEAEDIHSKMSDNVLARKTVQNNSTNESKLSCTYLATTTNGNSLISKEQMSGVQVIQNLTLNNTVLGATTENNGVERIEIDNNADLSECEVKKEKPYLVDRSIQCGEEQDRSEGELSSIGYNQNGKDELNDARRSRIKLKEARIVVSRISMRTIKPPPPVDIDSGNADVKEVEGPPLECAGKEAKKTSCDAEAFRCAVCLAVFRSHVDYEEHVASHVASAGRRRRGRPSAASTEAKPYLCNVCGDSFMRKGHLSSHLRMHSAERPFQCPVCGAAFKFNYNLNRHLLTHNAGKPHACGECGKRFKHASYLKQHASVHSAERPHACALCQRTFKLRSCLLSHLKTHSGERPFACAVCGKTFYARESLTGHLRCHTGEKPFACDVCGKAFAERGNLRQHARTHSGDRPFGCGVCGRAFAHSSHRARHMRTHTGDKPFACDACGKALGTRRALQEHALLHAGRRPFVCATCGAAFALERRLRTHLRNIHARTYPHVCGVCAKPLSSLSSLRQHMGTHSDDRPFVCATCGAAFRSKCVLVIHTRTHTGVRPFACDACGATYAHRSALALHLRTHTGERPFACDACGKTFAEKTTLALHLRTHTGEKPFVCGVCGRAFSVHSSRSRHMKVHAHGYTRRRRTRRSKE